MKFSEFKYKRPEVDQLTGEFDQLLDKFTQADSADIQLKALERISDIREEFDTMHYLCSVRHSVDSNDGFYELENAFFDENAPVFENRISKLYEALVSSPFKEEIKKEKGALIFKSAENGMKVSSSEVLEDLKKENQLKSEYGILKAKAIIPFKGENHNISTISKFFEDTDRDIRKGAMKAQWSFFADSAEKIEGIFHELVQVRTGIAEKLGYRNFVELGYDRMNRMDYDADMVKNFRDQILEHIVPIATKLRERQRQRLGLEKLYYYDERFKFKTGNATPKGSPKWIIKQAETMYKELSPETDEFFSFMQDKDLMDLEAREGKAPGGYCTYFPNYKTPFIFSNFNGSEEDVYVLTHEAGHAFQVYSSRDTDLPEYIWPTYEACEIHSMSMEFFTRDWMHLFFKEDAGKYRFSHLTGAVFLLPLLAAGDEFQHGVYENPGMTPAERNKLWSSLEKKYLPHLNYEGNEFLEKGGAWQYVMHYFGMPFYFIDYALAQVCAFQFLKRDIENHEDAWADYVKLCQAGGTRSFLELVDYANLQSPFEGGCVESVVGIINDQLSQMDDSGW